MLANCARLRFFSSQFPEVLNQKWSALPDHWSSKKWKLLGKWFCFKKYFTCRPLMERLCILHVQKFSSHSQIPNWPVSQFWVHVSLLRCHLLPLPLLLLTLSSLLLLLFLLFHLPFCHSSLPPTESKKLFNEKNLMCFINELNQSVEMGAGESFFAKGRWIFGSGMISSKTWGNHSSH